MEVTTYFDCDRITNIFWVKAMFIGEELSTTNSIRWLRPLHMCIFRNCILVFYCRDLFFETSSGNSNVCVACDLFIENTRFLINMPYTSAGGFPPMETHSTLTSLSSTAWMTGPFNILGGSGGTSIKRRAYLERIAGSPVDKWNRFKYYEDSKKAFMIII